MSEFSFRKITNFLAFVGVVCCALSLIVGKWVPLFNEIAAIIAIVITVICAFFFVKAKRSPTYMIIFILSVALIVVFKVWTLVA